MRILVTDDSVFMRSAIGRALEAQPDFEIVGKATNGIEAVTLAKELRPDVITMDIEMPEMDGLEATGELRKREGDDAHTIVIALTANAMRGDRERCIAAGMDDYLSKPLTRKSLEAVLEKWLGTSPAEPSVATPPAESGSAPASA